MSKELLSVFVWTGAFLLLELPAVFGLVPWDTLSGTVRVGESWWWPLAIYVPLFMLVLLGHFELGWSAGWVIAVTFLGVAIIASHLLGWLTF